MKTGFKAGFQDNSNKSYYGRWSWRLMGAFILKAWLAMMFGVAVVVALMVRIDLNWWQMICWAAFSSGLVASWIVEREARSACVKIESDKAELIKLYNSTVRCLAGAIDARDFYNYEHVSVVEFVACETAACLGMRDEDIQGIRTASYLLDVGKLGVPENILLRPGRPRPEEFAAIHNHPIIGAQIMEGVAFPWPVTRALRSHHERWDGSGYPDRLQGNEIPLEARILAVADVYGALTSNRAYRSGWTHIQAVQHISKLSGIHFDPEVVKAFLRIEPKIIQLRGELDAGVNGKAAAAIARINQEFVALWDIAQSANSSLDLNNTLDVVAKKVADVLGCDSCAIFMTNEEMNRVVCRSVFPSSELSLLGASAPFGSVGTGHVAREMRAMIIRPSRDVIFNSNSERIYPDFSWSAIAPLRSGNRCNGVICVYRRDRDFSIQELDLLEALARHAAVPVSNASLYEQTRENAQRDALTGLHNIRYLSSKMERELSRAARLTRHLSIIAVDLNRFKLVNDTLGHLAGDALLKDVARLLQQTVREYDSVVRYGGDEFLIVLPEAGSAEAGETIHRLQSSIESYVNGLSGLRSIGFGASFGAATYPGDGTDAKSLIASADARMYANKNEMKASLPAV